jgi:hypothetical protein
MAVRALLPVLLVILTCAVAGAQPASDQLVSANAAASAGDWQRVDAIVAPLLQRQMGPTHLAEAHRLAGLAAYFQQRFPAAETHFVEYLKLELDARLDPAVYPPDAVTFFQDVQVRHAAELRARRPKQKRYWLLNLIPPGGQIQNGERTKAIVLGSALGVFAVANISTFLVLSSWCKSTSGPGGNGVTCDENKDRSNAASTMKLINVVSAVGLAITYVYGVYDGVSGYRRNSERQPYLMPVSGGGVVGIGGKF